MKSGHELLTSNDSRHPKPHHKKNVQLSKKEGLNQFKFNENISEWDLFAGNSEFQTINKNDHQSQKQYRSRSGNSFSSVPQYTFAPSQLPSFTTKTTRTSLNPSARAPAQQKCRDYSR